MLELADAEVGVISASMISIEGSRHVELNPERRRRWGGVCKIAASILIAMLPLIAGIGLAEPSLQPISMDFDADPAGAPPSEWKKDAMAPDSDVSFTTVEDHSEQGGKSALLTVDGSSQNPVGAASRSFDSTSYRGRWLRYRAAVKTDAPVSTKIGLWFRANDLQKNVLVFDNMSDRPIRSSDWGFYDIVFKIPETAEKLTVGVLSSGKGKVWVDSATLTVLQPEEAGYDPPRPLTPRGLGNIESFAKLFGYIRFFYPGNDVESSSWDDLAIAGVGAVEDARSATELADRLQKVFATVAPAVRVYQTDRPLPAERPAPDPVGAKRIAWRHYGVKLDRSGRIPLYKSERVYLSAGDERKPLNIDLGGGVSALVPMSAIEGASGLLDPEYKVGPNTLDKPPGFRPSGADRTTRIADIVLAWTVFEHFYPYFDAVKVDWPSQLRTALARAATDHDDDEFETTLSLLVAALNDGHGYVASVYKPAFNVPIRWEWISGQLVVTGITETLRKSIAPGDIVAKIDGRPVGELIREIEPLVSSSTTQWRDTETLRRLATRKDAKPVLLQVRHADGRVSDIAVEPATTATALTQSSQHPPTEEVGSGVWYVDLSRITSAIINEHIADWSNAKAVIIDVREYPAPDAISVLAHLSPTAIRTDLFEVPIFTAPERRDVVYDGSGSWKLEPVSPIFKGKLVFLCGGGTISQGETIMGMVEGNKLGEIVGGPTAGTNGNINSFQLPGGYAVIWTGMRVRKLDGSRFQGIGVLPTVRAERSIEGVRAGRDEVLEAGLKIAAL